MIENGKEASVRWGSGQAKRKSGKAEAGKSYLLRCQWQKCATSGKFSF